MTFDREAAWLDKIMSRLCPTCNQHIATAEKRSCCIYAMPCQHRLAHKGQDWLLDVLNEPDMEQE